MDAATPSRCRVSEVNLRVNKWWVLSGNLVTAGIRGVRVKSSAHIQRRKHIQLCNSGRERPSYFMSTSPSLHMWAANKLDGFIAVETTHNGSPLPRSGRRVPARRAGRICLAARKNTRLFSLPPFLLLLRLPLGSVESEVRSCYGCGERMCCRSGVAVSSLLDLLSIKASSPEIFFVRMWYFCHVFICFCEGQVLTTTLAPPLYITTSSFLVRFNETAVLAQRGCWLNFTAIIWQGFALVNHRHMTAHFW